MVPVIQQNKWLNWCQARQLDVAQARFALETCYYGVDLRSRPGTLLVSGTHIIHFSYSIRDTWWAMFEKSTKVEMPLQRVSVVRQSELSAFLNAVQFDPDAYFQIEMDDKTIHHLILQREGSKFVEAVSALGVRVE